MYADYMSDTVGVLFGLAFGLIAIGIGELSYRLFERYNWRLMFNDYTYEDERDEV